MKKILILIKLTLIAGIINAQIDTVFVRNLSLKYEEWCTIQYFHNGTDSATKKFYKRMRSTLVAANPPTMGTQAIVDSIPGRIAVLWFSSSKNWPDYIRDEIGDNIQTKIAAYTPILPYINTQIIINLQNYFINVIRKSGKETIEN